MQFSVVFCIKLSGKLNDQMNNLTKDADGTLLFEAYHCNGGGCWTELVESKMKEIIDENN